MRVMTWNIWDGGAARISLIAELIANASPDVLLLNEADDETVVADLAARSSYHYLWARGSGDKHIALLTRLPVARWRIYNRRPFTQAILAATLSLQPPDGQAPLRGDDTFRSGRAVSGELIQIFGVHLLPY